jgi:hypothetical protein
MSQIAHASLRNTCLQVLTQLQAKHMPVNCTFLPQGAGAWEAVHVEVAGQAHSGV